MSSWPRTYKAQSEIKKTTPGFEPVLPSFSAKISTILSCYPLNNGDYWFAPIFSKIEVGGGRLDTFRLTMPRMPLMIEPVLSEQPQQQWSRTLPGWRGSGMMTLEFTGYQTLYLKIIGDQELTLKLTGIRIFLDGVEVLPLGWRIWTTIDSC